MASTKLFIGGLSYQSTSDTLRDHFGHYGEVEDAIVITDRETGNSRGFGFVTFTNDADADKAIEGANGSDLDGRTIRVDKASGRREGGDRSNGGGYRGGRGGGYRGGNDRSSSYSSHSGGNYHRSSGGYGDRDRSERGSYSRGGRSGGFGGDRSGGYRSHRGGEDNF